MPIGYFPQSTPGRVYVDPKLFARSARVVFSRTEIPVAPGVNAGTDEDGYYPISAIYCEARGCKPPPPCGDDVLLFIDDIVSKCTVAINAFYLAQANLPVDPVVIDFRIKVAMGAVNSTVWQDSVTADWTKESLPINTKHGILAVVSGVGSTQYELWAKINRDEGNPLAAVEIRPQMAIERHAGQIAAWSGPLCHGVLLPDPCCGLDEE